MEGHEKMPQEGQEEFYVRIPLSNIRFNDPYEQQKLINLLCISRGEDAVKQIEDLLRDTIISIGFEHRL